jgi:Icc-related predicted phosphoesterase
MRSVCISDLHGHIKHIDVPLGDVLVIAGDTLRARSTTELSDFNRYLGKLPHKYKIVVAGNHDFTIEYLGKKITRYFLKNAIYLEDSQVLIDGIKFWGSPWIPKYYNWAFNLPRGTFLREKWELIPDDIDVLITHTPPFGILDKTMRNGNVGCQELLKRVEQIKPKVHIFGHIHESHGVIKLNSIQYVNGAICDEQYKPTNQPIIIDL